MMVEANRENQLAGVAGVYAPALVERTQRYRHPALVERHTRRVTGVYNPALVERFPMLAAS